MTPRLAALEAVTFGDLTDEAMKLLDSAVRAIKVDSTIGPPIYIPSPFRRDAETSVTGSPTGTKPPTSIPGKGFDVARILKPKITFEMREGWGRNRAFAPYGDPGPSRWSYVLLGLVAVGFLASYGGVRVVRDVRKR